MQAWLLRHGWLLAALGFLAFDAWMLSERCAGSPAIGASRLAAALVLQLAIVAAIRMAPAIEAELKPDTKFLVVLVILFGYLIGVGGARDALLFDKSGPNPWTRPNFHCQ